MTKKVILLVEDDPDDEALALRALRRNNIKNDVVVVRDGAEALDYLFATGTYASRDANDLPQVVLLDLKLPKVDGLEVLRQFKKHPRFSTIPMVMLTASGEDRDVQRAYELGANSYIVKPVDFARFVEVAAQIQGYWCLLNHRCGEP